jgi:proline iminopeptidase
MLAMEYTLRTRPPEVESLILCSSPASIPRWIDGCNELLAELPEWNRKTIAHHEEHGYTSCPHYSAAILEFYRRHLCRLDEWPDGVERSFRDAGYQVYGYMNGPSEFTVVGTLKDWSVMDQLGRIDKPTLVVSGEHDELRPEHAREIHAAIAGSELQILDGCSHLSFAEDPEAFYGVANDFLDRVEAKVAG